MTGHFNFRDHCYKAVSSVLHYFFHFFLCVITAIVDTVIACTGVAANDSAIAVTTYSCKTGVFFYLDTPSLVICKMPVENIKLMISEIVNVFFYKGHRRKMATYIEVHTAVLKPGAVYDLYIRQGKYLF